MEPGPLVTVTSPSRDTGKNMEKVAEIMEIMEGGDMKDLAITESGP